MVGGGWWMVFPAWCDMLYLVPKIYCLVDADWCLQSDVTSVSGIMMQSQPQHADDPLDTYS